MFGDVEGFSHSAKTQLSNWEELVSAGWEYARQFSIDENGEEDEYGLGKDIQSVIGQADRCWQRKWIEGVFQFHPTIQTLAELRCWCQLQFEALRVLNDLRGLADYQATYEDRPRATCGRNRDPVFSLEVRRRFSGDEPPEGRIHFGHWTCEDTIRLALPALYELDLPATRTGALVKMLEDRHVRDIVGRALSWSEWTRHVQQFRVETYGLCPSKCHDQPITFGELFERAWEYMRQMRGRFLPKEPSRVTTLGDARRQLDRVIHWCDQEEARQRRQRKMTTGLEVQPVVTEITPKGRQFSRMTVAEANEEAMRLAKVQGKSFLFLSERQQAKQIGCSWETWTKTDFYKKAKEKKASIAARITKGGSSGSARVVGLTTNLETTIGKGDKDEVLKQLISESQTEANKDPSPLEDDPPDRPRRVRTRKRL
jgi:hypothetical protein